MSGLPGELPVPPGYRAATSGAAWAERARARLTATGRAPEQVLSGLVSGRVPPALAAVRPGLWQGRAEGSALLTPKGRLVAELRLLRAGPAAEDGFLLDFPEACRAAAGEHLKRYVPPRLAHVGDVTGATAMLTLLGPEAPARLAEALGGALQPEEVAALGEGDLRSLANPHGSVQVVRTAEVSVPAFDVLGPAAALEPVRQHLRAAGLEPLSGDAWEALRVEAGRPAFGADLDESVIPVEAGIHPRVVDYRKGCFTGQEVLIRIRDRGHVNRHLRGLRLGRTAPPPAGTELFRPGEERAVGHVTSAARSPRQGETLALGYVRREVAPPAELRLGSPGGPPLTAHDLELDWGVSFPGSGAPAPGNAG